VNVTKIEVVLGQAATNLIFASNALLLALALPVLMDKRKYRSGHVLVMVAQIQLL
jgi:hypothetical protein